MRRRRWRFWNIILTLFVLRLWAGGLFAGGGGVACRGKLSSSAVRLRISWFSSASLRSRRARCTSKSSFSGSGSSCGWRAAVAARACGCAGDAFVVGGAFTLGPVEAGKKKPVGDVVE